MRNDEENGMNAPAHDDHIWTALVRFSRAPLDPDDAAALERWVGSDPTRRDMVRAVQRLAAMTRQRPSRARSAEAWRRVSARMAGADAPRPRYRGFEAATGRRRRARPRWRAIIAGAGLLAASLVLGIAQRARIERAVSEWLARGEAPRELATRVGERTTVHLEDGTVVTLGPMSRLRYGRFAGARRRTVQLDGEAYFHVAPDASHPFRVLARYAAVQVVGTAFDVRAYPGDSVVQVLTTHGRVALRPRSAPDQGGALVEPGERGVVDTSGFVRVSTADVARGTEWTEGRLSYQLVPLDALLRDLARWYDLRFTLADPTLASVRVTVTFENATANDVVEQLAGALEVPYVEHGDTVRLGRP